MCGDILTSVNTNKVSSAFSSSAVPSLENNLCFRFPGLSFPAMSLIINTCEIEKKNQIKSSYKRLPIEIMGKVKY